MQTGPSGSLRRPRPAHWVLLGSVAGLLGSTLSCGPAEIGELPEEVCVDENALNICPNGVKTPGIDVSKWQGTVDWQQVKASGQVFGIARVSDGLNYPDGKFQNNMAGMTQAQMVRGVYQFFRPGQDPVAQADYLIAQLNQAGGLSNDDLPPILDIETADGMSSSVVRQKMQVWLDRVEAATGRTPIIYTAAFMSNIIGAGFSRYPLWVANYGATCPLMPGGWNGWVIWQYSSTGSVPGISGNVDMNHFNGTYGELIAFANSTVLDAGVPDAGTPPIDAGAPPTDAGAPPADAGAAADAGLTDGGEPTQPPPDAGAEDGGDRPAGAGNVDQVKVCRPVP